MDLPLDIWRLIMLNSKINDIKNICLLDKTFNSLCNEKSLWVEKFKEKDLMIINTNLNTFSQYLDEYKKVSYARYIAISLFELVKIEEEKYNMSKLYHSNSWIYPFDIKYLSVILEPNILSSIKFKRENDDKVFINLEIKDGGCIRYYTCEKYYDDLFFCAYYGHDEVLITNNNSKNILISFLTKLLYHVPELLIFDTQQYKRIFTKDQIINWNNNASTINEGIVYSRINYWKECYSKHKELYF